MLLTLTFHLPQAEFRERLMKNKIDAAYWACTVIFPFAMLSIELSIS